MHPITGNYTTYGYVVIRAVPLSVLQNARDGTLKYCIPYAGRRISRFFPDYPSRLYKNRLLSAEKNHSRSKRIRAGNLAHHIDVNTRDEMGYLAATLNYMSDELNKMEEYQKTFIANVSHDFRSPLTSIKGYLEAILDGTIPPEMYEKYFDAGLIASSKAVTS